VTDERFLEVLGGLVDDEQAARIQAALQPILTATAAR
jgi:hypothetical protein